MARQIQFECSRMTFLHGDTTSTLSRVEMLLYIMTAQGGRTRSRAPSFCMMQCKVVLLLLPWEKAGLRFQCILKSILHEETTNELLVSLYTLLRACTKQLCRWPCSLIPRMSANADFSTLLKCLASGKKSIEQLCPSAPRQTSTLELLVVYCFHILLVYPCALFYGMLILSHVLGACPTPLTTATNPYYISCDYWY